MLFPLAVEYCRRVLPNNARYYRHRASQTYIPVYNGYVTRDFNWRESDTDLFTRRRDDVQITLEVCEETRPLNQQQSC